MEPLPVYVPIVFVATVVVAEIFLLLTIKRAGTSTLASRILIAILPVWTVLQAVLASTGFYQDSAGFPPRLFLFGVAPCLLLIILFFVFFRTSFIAAASLKDLTWVHIVRIPVEIVLLWLFIGGGVPRVMTFEGRNFDIASGILALIVYFAAFRSGRPNRVMLIVFNIVGLLLLFNIVTIAMITLASPIQQMAFDQPNRAVLYFPYIWLPTIVVPVVLFSHLAALWKLMRNDLT